MLLFALFMGAIWPWCIMESAGCRRCILSHAIFVASVTSQSPEHGRELNYSETLALSDSSLIKFYAASVVAESCSLQPRIGS